MKKRIYPLFVFYALFSVCGSLSALGEKTLTIGGKAGWDAAVNRLGLAEIPAVRPVPVIALSSRGGLSPGERDADLSVFLSFDEGRPELFADKTGRCLVTANPPASAVSGRRARAGAGAVHFAGIAPFSTADAEPLVITPIPDESSLLPGRRSGDFTLEFWLNGENMENGEQVFLWTSTRSATGDNHSHIVQRIQAEVSRNRLQWVFQNFFTDPRDQNLPSFSFTGITPLAPQTWNHHLIRFDSNTGLLEYLVNGQTENILYTTSSGREWGEVYTPVTGGEERIVLGRRFAGMMDEFRFYSFFAADPSLQKYPSGGGRLETQYLDLGKASNEILKIEARGGCVSYPEGKAGGTRERVLSTVSSGDRPFSFPDNSEIRFFARTSETPFPRVSEETAWIPFEPGTELKDLRGRYIQIAAEFYPSGSGETTPYLEELRVTYIPDDPPRPPAYVSAVPRNGAVELSWGNSPDRDTTGYLVYYGVSKGDFFGDDAAAGASPINVGKRNSILIEGLSGGVLYYFAVSAYDSLNPAHAGEFSREASARPFRIIE
jgi:hypothetical protein